MLSERMHLLAELKAILPEGAIVSEQEMLRAYECDGLSAYKQLPLLVVMPDSVAQVQAALRLCSRMQVPVVARGAGTGLSGGALPRIDDVLLSLARFNRILDVDPRACTARVPNLAISKAARQYGLYYAPDPSSQVACSIGGNVAENSGGVHCLKYGLTVHNVLKLLVVTASGELLTIGSDALDSPGYDLLALMHGSEGMLGGWWKSPSGCCRCRRWCAWCWPPSTAWSRPGKRWAIFSPSALSPPAAAAMPPLAGDWLLEWGGALRWLKSDAPVERVRATAEQAGGHAMLFRGGARHDVFHPLSAPLLALHQRLKQGFDPQGLFNPGLMAEEL